MYLFLRNIRNWEYRRFWWKVIDLLQPFVTGSEMSPLYDDSSGVASVETYDYAIQYADTLAIIVDITVLRINVIGKFFQATKNVAIWDLNKMLPNSTIIPSHGMSDFTRCT